MKVLKRAERGWRWVSVKEGRAGEEGEGSVSGGGGCSGEGSDEVSDEGSDEGSGDEGDVDEEEGSELGAGSDLCSGPASDWGGCSRCSGGGGVGVVDGVSLGALDSGSGLLVLSSGVGRGGNGGGG
jgi:hypothetical protein